MEHPLRKTYEVTIGDVRSTLTESSTRAYRWYLFWTVVTYLFKGVETLSAFVISLNLYPDVVQPLSVIITVAAAIETFFGLEGRKTIARVISDLYGSAVEEMGRVSRVFSLIFADGQVDPEERKILSHVLESVERIRVLSGKWPVSGSFQSAESIASLSNALRENESQISEISSALKLQQQRMVSVTLQSH